MGRTEAYSGTSGIDHETWEVKPFAFCVVDPHCSSATSLTTCVTDTRSRHVPKEKNKRTELSGPFPLAPVLDIFHSLCVIVATVTDCFQE